MPRAPKPPRDITAAVRELCLWFPETEEVLSHGSPDFRVRGKTFATYSVNHHGDGRIALILHSPPGTQQFYVEGEPDAFYKPPYVGAKGWLGVLLDKGLPWDQIASLTREAFAHVAAPGLMKELGPNPKIAPRYPSVRLVPVLETPLSRPAKNRSVACIVAVE